MGFLRESIASSLTEALKSMGCPDHIIERTIDIPEDQIDNHMYAHAQMVKRAGDEDNSLYFALSAAVLLAIVTEAKARGLKADSFPVASEFMKSVIGSPQATRH